MKHRSALVLGALLISACLADTAFAHAYAGAAGGASRLDLECPAPSSCDRDAASYKAFVGYMVNPGLGLELAYFDQGKASASEVDSTGGRVDSALRGRGAGAYVLLVAPFADRSSLFGRLGVVTTHLKVDANSAASGQTNSSESHTHFAWGVGVGYEFTQNIGGRIELERARVKFHGARTDVDLLTMSLLYRF